MEQIYTPVLPTDPAVEKEPVTIGGAVQGLFLAIAAAGVGFEIIDLDATQIGLLLAVFVALEVLITVIQRSRVSPMKKIDASTSD